MRRDRIFQLWPGPPGRSIGARSVASSSDSPLEGTGFEPSVPREAPGVVLVSSLVAPTFPFAGNQAEAT